jgi:uncharacterized protein YjiS (DUF1127 family)
MIQPRRGLSIGTGVKTMRNLSTIHRGAYDITEPAARTVPSGESLIARLVKWPVRYYRGRRELAELAGMTDGELRDIGLTRGDLANVSALPRDADPTVALVAVVHERRRWRHD